MRVRLKKYTIMRKIILLSLTNYDMKRMTRQRSEVCAVCERTVFYYWLRGEKGCEALCSRGLRGVGSM